MLEIAINIEVREQDRYSTNPWARSEIKTVVDESQVKRFVNDSVDRVVTDIFRQHNARVIARATVTDAA